MNFLITQHVRALFQAGFFFSRALSSCVCRFASLDLSFLCFLFFSPFCVVENNDCFLLIRLVGMSAQSHHREEGEVKEERLFLHVASRKPTRALVFLSFSFPSSNPSFFFFPSPSHGTPAISSLRLRATGFSLLIVAAAAAAAAGAEAASFPLG